MDHLVPTVDWRQRARALMRGDRYFKLRDQISRRARLDLDDQPWKPRCHGWREIQCCVNDEGDVKTHEDFHQGRTVPIHQIYVQDGSTYDPGCEEGQSFLATRDRPRDTAADVLHGECQVQRDKGLILGHEDGYVIQQ